MGNPWSDTVRLGIVSFMARPELAGGEGPQAETARALLADGVFEALETGPVAGAEERKAVREAARARRASLGYCCQPLQLARKLDLNALDETARLRAVDEIRLAIAQARDLEAEGIAVMSGPNVTGRARGRAVDALVNSLVMIAREAYPVPVHLAAFDYDVEKRALVGPTALAVEIVRRVREASTNAGLLLDLSHLPLVHERPREALEVARDVLTLAHVGNCVLKDRAHPRYGDQHPRFGMPGGETGVTELADFITGLFAVGYLVPGRPRAVSIEVKPGPDETMEHLMTYVQRVWADAWARAREGAVRA